MASNQQTLNAKQKRELCQARGKDPKLKYKDLGRGQNRAREERQPDEAVDLDKGFEQAVDSYVRNLQRRSATRML
jgi:hypothetical protein